MAREAEALREWMTGIFGIQQLGPGVKESQDASLRSVDFGAVTSGHLSPLLREAMGNALVKMTPTQSERFYQGFILWTEGQEDCRWRADRSDVESNARGMMWDALAVHGRTYEKLYQELKPGERGKK